VQPVIKQLPTPLISSTKRKIICYWTNLSNAVSNSTLTINTNLKFYVTLVSITASGVDSFGSQIVLKDGNSTSYTSGNGKIVFPLYFSGSITIPVVNHWEYNFDVPIELSNIFTLVLGTGFNASDNVKIHLFGYLE
jgi:hypothetical protein